MGDIYTDTLDRISPTSGNDLTETGDKHDRDELSPHDYIVLLIIILAGILGTFGNLLVHGALVVNKYLHTTCNMFVANLALADLCVAAFVNSFSIVAIYKGEEWFDREPTLCYSIGIVCVITCTVSLMSITCVSINRMIHICHPQWYSKIFTKTKTVIMCIFIWIFCALVTSPHNCIGDFNFDKKLQSCLWDRKANYGWSVAIIVVVIGIPVLLTAACYIRIFTFVIASKKRVAAAAGGRMKAEKKTKESARLAKTLFVIYIVFVICWSPYAILVVGDVHDAWPHGLYIWSLILAHGNSSLNFILYGLTNKQFRAGYFKLLHLHKCCKRNDLVIEQSQTNTVTTLQ